LIAQDGSGLGRDPAGWHTSSNAPGVTGSPSSPAAAAKSGPELHESFAALETEPEAPTWVHAGAHRAEAGFQDPALGWVCVRADSSGGSVHAALVPGSADAAQTLAGHLAGLNAYLADHHIPVEAVTVAASENRPAAGEMGQSMSQNTNQGTGQGGTTGRQSTAETAVPAFAAAVSPGAGARMEGAASSLGGAHISVMA
jgi:hypothetical protein